MPKKFNASAFKSQMRQVERKMQSEIRREQCKVESQINREFKRAVQKAENDMNRQVRALNAKLRQQQQKNNRDYDRYVSRIRQANVYTRSVQAVHAQYEIVNELYQQRDLSPQEKRILELIDQEQSDCLDTANALESDEFGFTDNEDLQIGKRLASVSEDLYNRWQGAVFALNPHNPDAARHFCTSSRELLTDFIEGKAPNEAVFRDNPNADKTDNGTPTRREKIRYMMKNTNIDRCIVDYVESDIQNILDLFKVLSNATHGEAGTYSFDKLLQVKMRVTKGINFLCNITE